MILSGKIINYDQCSGLRGVLKPGRIFQVVRSVRCGNEYQRAMKLWGEAGWLIPLVDEREGGR